MCVAVTVTCKSAKLFQWGHAHLPPYTFSSFSLKYIKFLALLVDIVLPQNTNQLGQKKQSGWSQSTGDCNIFWSKNYFASLVNSYVLYLQVKKCPLDTLALLCWYIICSDFYNKCKRDKFPWLKVFGKPKIVERLLKKLWIATCILIVVMWTL